MENAMKTCMYILIMTLDSKGQLVAVLSRQGLIDLHEKKRLKERDTTEFTAYGELHSGESTLNGIYRLLREQLDLLPSHLIKDWDAKERLEESLVYLGEDVFEGVKRLFFGLLAPNSFLDSVRLRASSGGLCFATVSEIPDIKMTFKIQSGEFSHDSFKFDSIRKAFERF